MNCVQIEYNQLVGIFCKNELDILIKEYLTLEKLLSPEEIEKNMK
ncbi:hypothetical protein [Clostridium sp.]